MNHLHTDVHMIAVRHQKVFAMRIGEWLLSAILVDWGAVMLAHPSLLIAHAGLSNLVRLAPPEAWGAACLMLGLGRALALAINGGWRPTPHLRALGAFLTCFIWLMFSFCITNATSLVIAACPIFLLLEIYNVNRAMTDARVADDTARQRGVITSGPAYRR